MSRIHINAYRTKLAKLHAVSGSLNEGVLRAAFGGLLESWGRSQDLTLVNEWEGTGSRGKRIAVDGALVPGVLRIPFGFWEAKDSKDDLDREIADKRRKGYPDDNIIYEDTVTAVLRQNGAEVDRAALQGDDAGLLRLLTQFFAFERPEIFEFRKAARSSRPICRKSSTRCATPSTRLRQAMRPTLPPPPASSRMPRRRSTPR